MMRTINPGVWFGTAGLLLSTTICYAQEHGRGPMREHSPEMRKAMHEAAVKACADQKDGDACTLTFGDHTVDGTCKAGMKDDTTLACRPKFKLPEAAVDACTDLSEGDDCKVTFRDHDVDGTCRKPMSSDDDATLACFPHPPAPPKEAVDACTDLSEGDDCKVTFNNHDIDGHCRKVGGEDAPLACFPPHMMRGMHGDHQPPMHPRGADGHAGPRPHEPK